MQEAAPVSDTEAKPGQSTSFPQHLSLLRGLCRMAIACTPFYMDNPKNYK